MIFCDKFFIRVFVSVLCIGLGCVLPVRSEDAFDSVIVERPQHHGVALAYPVEIPRDFPVLSKFLSRTEEAAKVMLRVDTAGMVTEVVVSARVDSAFFEKYRPFLEGIRFEPGLFGGVKVEQRIPMWFRCVPKVRFVGCFFPVDTSFRIDDADLYREALQLNGIGLPSVSYFPKYFNRFVPGESLLVYPYVLARISLDSAGVLTAIEQLHDGGGFTDQILTAANWADYVPLRIDGKAKESENLLLVSLFRESTYPARPLTAGDTVAVRERLRVRLLPDTLGVMSKPVARNVGDDGLMSLWSGGLARSDTIYVRITVDTVGRASLLRKVGVRGRDEDIYREVVERMEFYPALDYEGRPREYTGMIRFEPVTSTKIRIRFCWHPGDCF